VTNQQESPDFALQGLEGAYVIEGRATVAALDERIQHHEHPKPPEHIGEWQYIQRETLSQRARPDLALKELEQEYVFESRSAVAAFIGQNRLRQLLLDARDPLNAAFGEATVKKLTPVEDDEGFRTLLCLTLIPGDMRAAMLALKSFDEHWWLPRSGQAGGRLNFDFELI
jgi:hypothetical protein